MGRGKEWSEYLFQQQNHKRSEAKRLAETLRAVHIQVRRFSIQGAFECTIVNDREALATHVLKHATGPQLHSVAGVREQTRERQPHGFVRVREIVLVDIARRYRAMQSNGLLNLREGADDENAAIAGEKERQEMKPWRRPRWASPPHSTRRDTARREAARRKSHCSSSARKANETAAAESRNRHEAMRSATENIEAVRGKQNGDLQRARRDQRAPRKGGCAGGAAWYTRRARGLAHGAPREDRPRHSMVGVRAAWRRT